VDAVKEIRRYNAGREAERLRLKYQKMRSSPFAFMRGACHLFYARLPGINMSASAPLVWACGDLHLENFGSFKGDNRLVYFDLNDFDEAALAPATWELVRVLTSIWVAAPGLPVSPQDADALCKTYLRSYAQALAAGKAYWVERETAQGQIRDLLVSLHERQRATFLRERTRLSGKRRVLKIDGTKTLVASPAQHQAVTAFMEKFAAKQSHAAFFKVLDVARRVAGTGSLGVERYAVLVEGKGGLGGHYLLDFKHSLPSTLAPHFGSLQPAFKSEAQRVVQVQRRMQAVSVALLAPVKFGGKPFVLRELQPQQDRLVLSAANKNGASLKASITTMGQMLAWAQLRSAGQSGSASVDELIAFGQRKKWQARLLLAARRCAQIVAQDAAAFNAAFDAGQLGA
jgi:uncharacterized protein (DUF2252 family)